MAENSDITADVGDVVGPFTDVVQQATAFIWDITSSTIPVDLH